MKTTPTTGGEAVAEQLPIVAHEYTDKRDGHRYVSNACESERLPEAVALTPYAPAQSALDELQLRAVEAEMSLDDYKRSFWDAAAERDELRREVEALRADRDRLDWLESRRLTLHTEWNQVRPTSFEFAGFKVEGFPAPHPTVRAAIDTARLRRTRGWRE